MAVIEGHHFIPGVSYDGEFEVVLGLTPLGLHLRQVVLNGVVSAAAARQSPTHTLACTFFDVDKNETVAVIDHGLFFVG